MIVVFGAGAAFNLPDASPYVMKTEAQLRMAGLAYLKHTAHPSQSPKGQVPFINDDGELVADSTFIRAHLEQKYGFDFDEALCPLQRAQAWAFERMLENHLSWAMTYTRWIMPDNFAKGPAHFFDAAPEHLRDDLRRDVQIRVADALRAVGVGRHDPEEIFDLGERSIAALAALLGDKQYLFGDRPAGVDATAFALLAAIQTPHFDSPLRNRLLRFPALTFYVDRIMMALFPEHAWGTAVLEAA